MSYTVGMDLVDVSDVAESLGRFGDGYLRRVFTEREIAVCADGADVTRLAACFAAKEATLKALHVDDEPVDWRTIEVLVPVAGEPSATLHGRSAELAHREGLVRFEVSVSGGGTYASAVVLAERAGTGHPSETGLSRMSQEA